MRIEATTEGGACLSVDQIAELLAAQTSVPEWERHVETCSDCQRVLDELAGSGQIWNETFRALQRLSSRPQSTETTFNGTDDLSTGPTNGGESNDWIGRRIDGYVIVSFVARGGTGDVYLARDLRLGRPVAIKMLTGLDPESAVRFRSEAEATAKLQHQGIITVLDSGYAEQRPYLVMEWIAGGDLHQYLSGKPMAHRQAASLMRAVCEAISVAHQRGLVHRDLKPANLLLRHPEREEKSPVVTDFGLVHWCCSGSGLTRTGQMLGTPAFMPPEQASASEGWATEAVDIYSVGAILYQCLTGRPPHQAESTAKTLDLVLRGEVVSPRSLNPLVPRALETVCLKCLQASPAARYPSMDAVGEDLQRFLKGDPIRAKRPNLFQRLRTWSRRHRAMASLCATSFVCVLVVLLMWARFTRRLSAKTELAERRATDTAIALKLAQRSGHATAEVVRFITSGLFDRANPAREGASLTVIEALELAEPSLAERFAKEPSVEAALRGTIGNLYLNLGHPKRALPHLTRSFELHATSPLDAQRYDTALALAMTQNTLGDSAMALQTLDSLASWCEREDWSPSPVQAIQTDRERIAVTLASAADKEAAARSALKQLRELLHRCGGELGESSPVWLGIHESVGVSLYRLGEREAAAIHLKENYERTSVALGDEHADALNAAQNAAFMLVQLGKYAEAESIHRKNYRAKTQVFGRGHPSTIGTRSDLAMVLWRQGKRTESIETLQRVIDQRRDHQGIDHPDSLSALYQISRMYLESGRPREGAQFLRPHVEELSSYKHLKPDWVSLILTYGRLLHRSGEHEAGLAWTQKASILLETTFPEDKGRSAMLRSVLIEMDAEPPKNREP
ncbi:MAG: serine/threonine-protein kinase [Planctomycetota bacterium]